MKGKGKYKSKDFIHAEQELKENRKIRVSDVLNGEIIRKAGLARHFTYIVFITALAIFYISNRYQYEKLLVTHKTYQAEVKELRYESTSISTKLIELSAKQGVQKALENEGLALKAPAKPLYKIKIDQSAQRE